jgi:hypothetical protein
VLLALKAHDEAALERAFTRLRAFYAGARGSLPQSPQEAMMAGLNLLRLLTQNRVAEFHTELELVPKQVGGGAGRLKLWGAAGGGSLVPRGTVGGGCPVGPLRRARSQSRQRCQ